MAKKFARSSDDSMLFGVCGGLARYFDVSAFAIRIGVAILAFTIFSIPFLVIAYAITVGSFPLLSDKELEEGQTKDY